jgi:heme/copper-type cytochrome/quinol oxidase subunit 2
VRNFLITQLRCLVTFVGAAAASTALSMLASQAVTIWYRASHHVPAGVNLIEDLRYVTYHTLIVLPVFIVVLVIAAWRIWRWSRRFKPAQPPITSP